MSVDVRFARTDHPAIPQADVIAEIEAAPVRAVTSRRSGRWWVLVVVGLAVWSFAAALWRPERFNPAGFDLIERFIGAAMRPELDPAFLRIMLDATLITAAYAFVGTALSLVIGVVGGVFVSQTWWQRDPIRPRRAASAGWVGTRLAGAIPRGVHEVVWGLVLLRIFGLDPWVAVLAIGLPYGAMTAKVIGESIDDEGGDTYRTYRSAGVGRLPALVYGVAPTVLPDVVSYGLYRLECAVRASIVLGMIGAGGLGFQIAVSFQSLRYEEIWTLLAAVALLAAVTDRWSSTLRRRPTRRVVMLSALVAAIATTASMWYLELSPARLFDPDVTDRASDLAASTWPPRLPNGGWSTLARAMIDTLQLSVIAIVLAAVMTLPLAYLAARPGDGTAHWPRRLAGRFARAVLLGLRCVPPPIWALLVLFVVLPGPLAGGIALAIYTLGVLGRLVAEAIENSDRRTIRHLELAGVGATSAVAYGGVPVVAPRIASLSLYRWEVATRETVIVGLVGAGGLGRLFAEQNAAFDEQAMLTTVLALIAVSVAVDFLSTRLRAAVS